MPSAARPEKFKVLANKGLRLKIELKKKEQNKIYLNVINKQRLISLAKCFIVKSGKINLLESILSIQTQSAQSL